MVCRGCGTELQEHTAICEQCGVPVDLAVEGGSDVTLIPPPTKKKKLWIPVIVVGMLLAAMVFGMLVQSEANEYLHIVRQGSPLDHPNQTYEEAFRMFFKDPKWSYFVSEDGENVVEFRGKCLYLEQEVSALIQFIVDGETGYFQMHYLSLNEVPQNVLIMASLIEAAFTQ